jgi:hypothetical protein
MEIDGSGKKRQDATRDLFHANPADVGDSDYMMLGVLQSGAAANLNREPRLAPLLN